MQKLMSSEFIKWHSQLKTKLCSTWGHTAFANVIALETRPFISARDLTWMTTSAKHLMVGQETPLQLSRLVQSAKLRSFQPPENLINFSAGVTNMDTRIFLTVLRGITRPIQNIQNLSMTDIWRESMLITPPR